MKLVIKLILPLAASIVIALVLTFLMHRPSNEIKARWQQPASIKYDNFDPYYLSVVEGDVDWRYFPLSWQRHHHIYVGREKDAPDYGHYVDFSFHPGADDLESHLSKSKVEWSEEGVEFGEASGHRLFIPKRMFIGGR